MKKIFFDVGANFGTSSIHKAKSDPETIVYAFEPTPELILHLKTQTFYLKNYNVVGKAVSDYEDTIEAAAKQDILYKNQNTVMECI